MTINVRDLIADAILNAECENQPTCTGCMSASVVAELDRAGMVFISAEDLRAAIEVLEAVNDPWAAIGEEPALEARLRAALPERTANGS